MIKTYISLLTIAALYTPPARAQAGFQNLDFEAAKVIFVGGVIATSNALPGWSAFSSGNQLDTISYNVFTMIPPVQVYGSNVHVIAGEFSVSLAANGSISQTGLIPSTAQSLLFKALTDPIPTLQASLGGQALTLTPVSNGSGYVLYGADISSFAGQPAALAFFGDGVLDDIVFSPNPVPEPAFPALLGIGVVLHAALLRARARKT